MADEGAGGGGGAEDPLRQLDASLDAGRGDYKRALLLRFLHDQARINQRLDEMAATADEDCSGSSDGSCGAGGGAGGGSSLAASLRDLDVGEDMRSLNAVQLHQRRLQLSSGGGGYVAADNAAGWGKLSAPAAAAVRPRSSSRQSASAAGSRGGGEQRRTCSTGELERREEAIARETLQGGGGGGASAEARDERRANQPSRISLDSRPAFRQLSDGRPPYAGGCRLHADAAAAVASSLSSAAAGTAASYAAGDRAGGASVVKLPALFKQAGVGKFDYGAIRYAGVNNA